MKAPLHLKAIKETPVQIATASFLKYAWPPDLPYTHFPAGEARDKRTAAKLKAMGLIPGWPDWQFILPNAQAGFIEMKRPVGGVLSPDQIAVMTKLVACGCGYKVCTSVEAVEETLARWLALYGRKLLARTVERRLI